MRADFVVFAMEFSKERKRGESAHGQTAVNDI